MSDDCGGGGGGDSGGGGGGDSGGGGGGDYGGGGGCDYSGGGASYDCSGGDDGGGNSHEDYFEYVETSSGHRVRVPKSRSSRGNSSKAGSTCMICGFIMFVIIGVIIFLVYKFAL
ncbi:loricrin-like [Penaeus japonicus]|uniref:loricrin-like n=1 Tax=Penaeus japonicus TaxID=27405 RepID=UPI001C70EEA6|nr:loricrin-like [Penaeus japonicus]